MKIRDDWRKRLDALTHGKSIYQLATKAGLNRAYLRDLKTRQQTPSLKNAQKLSTALGVPMDRWFVEGDEAQPLPVPDVAESSSLTLKEIMELPRDIPILATRLVPKEPALFVILPQSSGMARRPHILFGVKEAYGLVIVGDTMAPWREEGDPVLVNPNQPPKLMDYVVANLKGDTHRIGRLIARAQDAIKLRQYKPGLDLDIAASEIETLHRIIDGPEFVKA